MRDTDAMNDTATTNAVARVRRRPELDRWMRDRDMDDRAAARLFGCTHQMVNAMRKPFDDPLRKEPGRALRNRIVLATQGAVDPRSFLPTAVEVLTGEAA